MVGKLLIGIRCMLVGAYTRSGNGPSELLRSEPRFRVYRVRGLGFGV